MDLLLLQSIRITVRVTCPTSIFQIKQRHYNSIKHFSLCETIRYGLHGILIDLAAVLMTFTSFFLVVCPMFRLLVFSCIVAISRSLSGLLLSTQIEPSNKVIEQSQKCIAKTKSFQDGKCLCCSSASMLMHKANARAQRRQANM